MTIAQILLDRRHDDSLAIVDAHHHYSWDEAVTEGARRAVIAEAKLTEGPPHIGVLLPNVPDYLLWLHAAALLGACVVGINPTRRGEALAADIRLTDCRLLVTDADGAAVLRAAGVDEFLVIDTPEYEERLAAVDDPAIDDVLGRATAVQREALYLLLFTSGTTGMPKAVRCTQGRLADIAAVAAPGYGYKSESICYCPMPLFHGNALMALWAPAVSVGAALALRPRFSASAFLDDVRLFGATTFSYVGKSIAYILATPEGPDDADNTLVSAFGTESSPRDRKRFYKRFGCYLIEGYGQSEGGAALSPVLGMPPGALGKPVGDADIAILDPETGDERDIALIEDGRLVNAATAIGEIVNRSGAGKFEGYYGSPDAEADRRRHGWYWTGDLGYRDAEGFFYFAGRRGDWLRVDSENFSAGPIESILSRHPDVSVVAVYGVPDPVVAAGDQVMAALELRSDAVFEPDGWSAWLAEQPDMGTKWTPRFIRISERLPETATGKITKEGLKVESWHADDPVWWRPDGANSGTYRVLNANDIAELDAAVARRVDY